jgi:23S rRNA (adenine2503-C2)-methyltransferase
MMKIIDKRDVPGLASLYLAEFPGEGFRLAEFVDTVEPGVAKTEKWVLMISTQFGCPVGCRMCDAGAMGFHGNLTAEQMLAQVSKVLADNPALSPAAHPKLKIHFARMGEPSLNPAVLEALERLPAEFPYPGLMPSLSTVAPANPEAEAFMARLAEVKTRHYPGGRFQLQISVHATESNLRGRIVPVPVWSLERIAAYGRDFVRPGDRKITLNFALSQGERLDTEKIKSAFDPELFLVKVTPVNPTYSAGVNGTAYVWNNPPAGLAQDAAALEAAGFRVILSPSAPEEIEHETSCGQLWASAMKERAAAAACWLTRENLPQKASAWQRELAGVKKRALPLDRDRCALLLVDLQEFFLDPASPAYLPQAAAVLPNAAVLARAFRDAGRPVFFTSHAHADPETDGGLMTRRWRKVCRAGTPHAKVSAALAPGDGEVFIKRRYSAFTNPELEPRLRALGINSLVVAGVMTNLCVESTVRAAFDLGYSCAVASDACAAATEEFHLASLKALAHGFAGVDLAAALAQEFRAAAV